MEIFSKEISLNYVWHIFHSKKICFTHRILHSSNNIHNITNIPTYSTFYTINKTNKFYLMKATSISDGNNSNNSNKKELQDHISWLLQDCLRMVMKLISAQDACWFAVVCSIFQSKIDSDDLWEHFLPADLPLIISRAGMDYTSFL